MDGGHVPRHISASSFEPDGVLAFITLSSLSIFFCWPAERILFFNLDSIIGVAVVLHLVDSGPVSPQILKTSHTVIALVAQKSWTLETLVPGLMIGAQAQHRRGVTGSFLQV